MTYLIGTASLAISLYVTLIFHQFDSDIATAICSIGLSLIYFGVLCLASNFEDKLEKRIKMLEEKLKCEEETKC